MELIINLSEKWNELFMGGAILYLVALTLVGVVFLLTFKGKTISAGVTVLVAGAIGQIAKTAFYVSMFLLVVKMILNFIFYSH